MRGVSERCGAHLCGWKSRRRLAKKPPNFAPICRFRADRMRKTAVFRQSCRQAQSSASRFRESKKAPVPGCFFCFGGSGEIRTRGRLPVTAFRVRLVMTTSIRFQSASYFTITRAVLQVFERCSAFGAESLRRAGVQERGEAAHRDGKCAARRDPFLRRGNNIISADSYFPA